MVYMGNIGGVCRTYLLLYPKLAIVTVVYRADPLVCILDTAYQCTDREAAKDGQMLLSW